MQPPILRWKVSLALVAVVAGAVALGSALGPTGRTSLGGSLYVTATPVHKSVSIIPSAAKPTRMTRRQECDSLRSMVSQAPKSIRRAMKRTIRTTCRKRG
jgi:hypothetical protein